MANAPGITVNVGVPGANSTTNAPTGTWFAAGQAHGPSGIAVPINSMTDFQTYFGTIVNGSVTGRYTTSGADSTLLYDSLDVYFREGGISAYVSRVVGAASVKAVSTASKFTFTAFGGGTWANSSSGGGAGIGLVITVSAATVGSNTAYTVTINLNGVLIATSPGLSTDLDVVNWVNSLPGYLALCTAVYNSGGTTMLPSPGSSANVYFSGTVGTDVAVTEATDLPAALTAFTANLGPGQVSVPGRTSTADYAQLTQHAMANNRVAILDGANTATAATFVTAVQTLQTTASTDASYAGMFAPWLTVPGVPTSTQAGGSAYVFSRTVPPSALAAARVAANDATNDANNPAAGAGAGSSVYSTGVTQTYSASDLGLLNSSGINVVKVVAATNQVTVYGFRSCTFDPNWTFLNNVRFRMQVVNDFDFLAEQFAFSEIDARGQVFARFNGALAGKCAQYWLNGSIYGDTAANAYSVNTGPQVNTSATTAAGQILAAVGLRMSPFAEFVIVNVTKYTVNAPLPA